MLLDMAMQLSGGLSPTTNPKASILAWQTQNTEPLRCNAITHTVRQAQNISTPHEF